MCWIINGTEVILSSSFPHPLKPLHRHCSVGKADAKLPVLNLLFLGVHLGHPEVLQSLILMSSAWVSLMTVRSRSSVIIGNDFHAPILGVFLVWQAASLSLTFWKAAAKEHCFQLNICIVLSSLWYLLYVLYLAAEIREQTTSTDSVKFSINTLQWREMVRDRK